MSDSTRAQSRRQLLTAAAGGVAALAAEALTRPHAVDAVSAALMTEVDNPTSAETSVTSSQSTTGDVAFKVAIGDLGTALHVDALSRNPWDLLVAMGSIVAVAVARAFRRPAVHTFGIVVRPELPYMTALNVPVSVLRSRSTSRALCCDSSELSWATDALR